jgi:hypothetical protein
MNKLLLGIIIGSAIALVVFLAGSNLALSPTPAQPTQITQGSLVYTFWGTDKCPAQWKKLQTGLAGTQVAQKLWDSYNGGIAVAMSGGSTICIDANLTTPNNGIETTVAGWTAGLLGDDPNYEKKFYNYVPCVVCEK